jgi:hypothetical protein
MHAAHLPHFGATAEFKSPYYRNVYVRLKMEISRECPRGPFIESRQSGYALYVLMSVKDSNVAGNLQSIMKS